MIRASSTRQPAASIVAIAPARSSTRSSAGIAATSFEPPGTQAVPRARRFSAAHAVTTCRHPVAVSRLAARADLPSMAIGTRPVAPQAAAIQRPNARADAPGASLAKTRSKVSGLGMPLSRRRKRRKNPSLVLPYSAIASRDSAPPMTAQVATVRMSVRSWSVLAVSRRGSGTSAKTAVIGSGGMGWGSWFPPGIAGNPYAVSSS
ncbi:hypothetical protein ElP_25960 [Tautonia plasticadhaerens]|uniref:Uncharacterized protein n=1 Tax=Tautonia plasticadhaerens TaxID=2527974 RepID=A0A518H1I6_9BACT|nr:hypothetical protein ElP_25960 [Tautonia plasticadhaerens]